MDAEALTELKAQRFAFLRAVYDACDGGTLEVVHQNQIEAQLGYDNDLVERISHYLRDEGLIEFHAMGPTLEMTHAGIVEVEEAIAQPDKETEHFPSLVRIENLLHVGSIVGSAVQQGTQGSTQIVGQPLDVEALWHLVAEFRDALGSVALTAGEREEAEADLATLEAQLASPNPKRAIVHEALASVQRVVEGALGSGLASAAPQLPALAAQLAHLLASL